MFSSALSVPLTLAFAATGVFSLVRLSRLTAAAQRPADRLVELFHLVMSLAMIGMTWAWSGGPETRSGLLQIVVFGTFALWFGHTLIHRSGHDRVARSSHLTMAGATVWMVAAMPVLMGVSGAPTGVGGHAGHGGHGSSGDGVAGMEPGPVAAPPAAAVAVTAAFAVLLVGFAVVASVRGARSGVADRRAERGTRVGAAGNGAVAGATSPVITAAVITPAALTSAADTGRLALWSHALMNLAMAVMLVAML